MSARSLMHYVGFCRICGTGPLGLRRCGGCKSVVILCDECDAVWTTADLASSPVLTDDPHLPCPVCHDSLVGKSSSWATREEIDASPWLAEAVAANTLELATGESFAPHGPDPLQHQREEVDDELGDVGG